MTGGLNPDIVKAIAEGRRPERMAEDEDIIYSLFDEIQRHQAVSDATYGRAVGKFGEQGVIDVMGIAGYYTMLAMVMNTARTPLPNGPGRRSRRFRDEPTITGDQEIRSFCFSSNPHLIKELLAS